METSIRAVHFTLDDSLRHNTESKLKRNDYAADYVVDLTVALARDARQFDTKAHLHFRWWTTKNVAAHRHDTRAVADQLLDKLFDSCRQGEGQARVDAHAARTNSGHRQLSHR